MIGEVERLELMNAGMTQAQRQMRDDDGDAKDIRTTLTLKRL
jgi:hypothetical protein